MIIVNRKTKVHWWVTMNDMTWFMTWIGLFCLLKPVGKYFSIQNQSMNGHILLNYFLPLRLPPCRRKREDQTWITVTITCKWKIALPFFFFRDWTPVHVGWYRFIFWKRHQSTISLGFVVSVCAREHICMEYAQKSLTLLYII